MRHHARLSAFVPLHHQQLDRTALTGLYLPRLNQSFTHRGMTPEVRWVNGGAVELAVAYEADIQAEEGHHAMWLNATLEAAQQAGLQVAEAYVTRSISMALLGGGAGVAGGYKAGGVAGAFIVGAIGLALGDLIRTHVPIYRAEYSPYYGWQLVRIQQLDPRNFQVGLA